MCIRDRILHCFEYAEQSEFYKVSGQTMGNAVEIGRYFRTHARAAFNIMGLTDSPEVRDAKYIMRRIDSTGKMEMKLRDLYKLCCDRKGMEKKEGMIPGLRCLTEPVSYTHLNEAEDLGEVEVWIPVKY